jgi:hypothetical protein
MVEALLLQYFSSHSRVKWDEPTFLKFNYYLKLDMLKLEILQY